MCHQQEQAGLSSSILSAQQEGDQVSEGVGIFLLSCHLWNLHAIWIGLSGFFPTLRKACVLKQLLTTGLESRLPYDHRLWSGMETCLYLSRVIRRELQAESWDREVVCARVARVSVHVQLSVRVPPPPPPPLVFLSILSLQWNLVRCLG